MVKKYIRKVSEQKNTDLNETTMPKLSDQVELPQTPPINLLSESERSKLE